MIKHCIVAAVLQAVALMHAGQGTVLNPTDPVCLPF